MLSTMRKTRGRGVSLWNGQPRARLRGTEYNCENEQGDEDPEDQRPDGDEPQALLDPERSDAPPVSLALIQRHCHRRHVTSRAPQRRNTAHATVPAEPLEVGGDGDWRAHSG